MSVIIMLALISILIIAHELGHFFVAKRCGVRVERFGFGLPFIDVKLWSKKIGDTEYCLHPLLFGGYVGFPDDNPDSDLPPDSPQRFENQPVGNRFAIAVAGVAVNAVLGWLLLIFVLGFFGEPTLTGDYVMISRTTTQDSPAAKANIQGGEVIVAINGTRVDAQGTEPGLKDAQKLEKRAAFVQKTIHANPNKPITLTLSRNSKEYDVPITPDGKGTIGVHLQTGGIEFVPIKNPMDLVTKPPVMMVRIVTTTFSALQGVIMMQVDPKELSGPIGIVEKGAKIIEKNGIGFGLILTAQISVILAVMNLLPIPALDGGHILFIAIEAIRKKPVKKEIQEGVVRAGVFCLLALMALILWNDIRNSFIEPVPTPVLKPE